VVEWNSKSVIRNRPSWKTSRIISYVESIDGTAMKPVKRRWQMLPPVVILRYWLHQSNFYLSRIELLHRWLLEIMVFAPLFTWFSTSRSALAAAVLAFLISHTASAVLNGHLWAMLCHDLFWVSLYTQRRPFFDYIDRMRIRLAAEKPHYMAGAVFFGSLARGQFRTTSDMDIRFIAQNGVWNGLRTAHLVFLERLRALFTGFPLDIYMFQSEEEIRHKMDVGSEHPISVYKYGEKLERILPETRSFDEFRDLFLGGPEPVRADDLEKARSNVA
jgi:predicted nucleotidyltransferase